MTSYDSDCKMNLLNDSSHYQLRASQPKGNLSGGELEQVGKSSSEFPIIGRTSQLNYERTPPSSEKCLKGLDRLDRSPLDLAYRL